MNFGIFFSYSALFSAVAFSCLGQRPDGASAQKAIDYRTGFYNFYWVNPDSALYYARKVASDTSYKMYLREMIHEDFYTMFHSKTKEKIKKEALKSNHQNWESGYNTFFDKIYSTLVKLASDSNRALASAAKPLLYWVNVELNKQNNDKVAPLIDEFIATQLAPNDPYQNATARYALFIYEAIRENRKLKDASYRLLLTTIEKLSSFQARENTYSSPQSRLKMQTWNRFIYSCATNRMAKRLVNEGNDISAGVYFKKSFESSPNIADLRFPNEYNTEAYFLLDSTCRVLETDYLNYLETHADNDQLLSVYLDLALKDPVNYKSKLRRLYDAHFQEKKRFSDFWTEGVNSTLIKAPAVTLQKIDGGIFSSARSSGKWILIDFWGTWCGLCREEHPDLQKFYQEVVREHKNEVELFTIACRDTEEKVKAYMSKYNYSFPVAMSDGAVTEAFNVSGYPTKVLITPQGNYLVIPSNADWVNFIKEYASL